MRERLNERKKSNDSVRYNLAEKIPSEEDKILQYSLDRLEDKEIPARECQKEKTAVNRSETRGS